MNAAKDEAPTAGGTAGGLADVKTLNGSDSEPGSTSAQALRVIEGERAATDLLPRLRCGAVSSDDLAAFVSMLYGAKLRGFCRVLGKALQGAASGAGSNE